jgi:predicted nucleic acid-binding protein
MANNQALIDTAGWASLFVKTEPHYQQARNWFDGWFNPAAVMVTTNYILTELIALFTSPLHVPRAQQLVYIDTIKSTRYVQVVHIDPNLDAAAWTLLKTRPDKDWSLVDAASFVVMTKRGITEALTTDHHFEQAGFTRLLKV